MLCLPADASLALSALCLFSSSSFAFFARISSLRCCITNDFAHSSPEEPHVMVSGPTRLSLEVDSDNDRQQRLEGRKKLRDLLLETGL